MCGQFFEIVECVEDPVGAVLSTHSLVLEFDDAAEATDFLGRYLQSRFDGGQYGNNAAGDWWGYDGQEDVRYRYLVRVRRT